MQIVENVDNVDNFGGAGQKVGKTVFWFVERIKKYPQILKIIFLKNLWILWIVIFEEDFRRFLPHPRLP